MTPNQSKVFEFIKRHISDKGYSPSYHEIMESMGYKSKSRVFEIIHNLITQNYLKQTVNAKRNLEIVQHYCPHCKGNLAIREYRGE